MIISMENGPLGQIIQAWGQQFGILMVITFTCELMAGFFSRVKQATTSWVKTNGIQGFQRIRRAFVLGDFKSTHTLKLEIGHDYQTYFNEKHLFNYINDLEVVEYGDSTPYGTEGFYGTDSGVADGVYQFRAHCKQQKCQSVRFRISDSEIANAGQAYSISSLMLEVGVRSNTMKLPAQKLT